MLQLTLDHWLVACACHHLEWPVADVMLNGRVRELAADKPLGIKHGVDGIHCHLVFGSVSNKPFSFREGHIGGSGAIALLVGYDLNAVMLPHTHTAAVQVG